MIPHWNWVMVDAQQRTSHYGPGFTAREDAIGDTGKLIEQLRASVVGSEALADAWLAGQAKDDTVFIGPFIFGLYQYDGTAKDRQVEAELWVVDLQGRS
ncbi:hypothetical protein [Nesterenkonia rhizosphaerae]|uniref:Uncharacterized protein n=1 Tax=Nesterenkonia rhizosphaerae TaxID=1348272 RepID=A0ABP9G018_9MICC